MVEPAAPVAPRPGAVAVAPPAKQLFFRWHESAHRVDPLMGRHHLVESVHLYWGVADFLDQLFVGPSDLSIALQVYPDFHSDKLWEAVSAVAAACNKHGKSWGAVAPDPAWAERAAELGCQLISMSNEVVALKLGVDALKGNFEGRF